MKKLTLRHFKTKEIIFEGGIEDKNQTIEAISKSLYRKVALVAGNNIIPYEIVSQCITSFEEVNK
jgi:hypothetical protein